MGECLDVFKMRSHELFADDIVLVDETPTGVNVDLETWRKALASKGF